MSTDKSQIDLTKHCTSFPKSPRGEVLRNSLVDQLAGMFSPAQRVIVVEGSESSGKSILLAQFCRRFKDSSISFFVGTDHWRSRPELFLEELCCQMQVLCPNVVQTNFENLDIHQLKTCFSRLYRALGKHAIRHNQPFYIVIDGIDLISEDYGSEGILTYLPSDPSDGIYILLSSTPGKSYGFEYIRWPIPRFSDNETETLLKDWLSPNQICHVYQESMGMPGYVGEIRSQLERGSDVDEVIGKLPTHLNELLLRNLAKIPDDPILHKILGIIVYSGASLGVDALCEITSQDETTVSQKLKSVSFLFEDLNSSSLSFQTNAHRRVLADHFCDTRPDIEQSLIQFHKQRPPSDLSHSELARLYSRTDRYDELVELLNPESVFRAIQDSKTTFRSIRNLRVLSQEAYDRNDLVGLAYAVMMESVLRDLIQQSSSFEREIEALLAMGRYQEAVTTSLRCGFPEDQLCLLAKACRYMGERQIEIPEPLIDTIEQTAVKIESLADMGQRLLIAVSDLFTVLPNTALKLVNRSRIDSTGINAMQGQLMDDYLVEVSLLEGSPLSDIKDIISDKANRQSLLEVIHLASNGLGQISCTDILTKAEKIDDTSAKVHLLLEWCRINQKEPETLVVVKEILHIFNQTDDYSPSPRRIRQLSQFLLETNTSVSDKRKVVEGLKQLRQTVAMAPREEVIIFDLLMARLEKHWAPEQAILNLYELYLDCDNIEELDIRCLVLSHILVHSPKIDPKDEKLHLEIRESFLDEFTRLLTHSADQWVTTRGIIRVLAEHRPELAVHVASTLNTVARRDKSFEEILRVYTNRKPQQLDVQFMRAVLNKIVHTRIRETTLLNVLRRITRGYTFTNKTDWHIFKQTVDRINDHCFKALSYGYLLRGIPVSDHDSMEHTWDQLLETIHTIGDCDLRLDVKFSLCIVLAERYPNYSNQLFDSTSEEKNMPLIASGLSNLYIRIMQLAVRAMVDVSKGVDRPQKVDALKKMISRCPSPIAQVGLLTDLAMRLFLHDMATEFHAIAKQIEGLLDSYKNTECYPYLVFIAAPALYEHSRTILEDRLSDLEPSLKDQALFRILEYTISQRSPDDPVDLEHMNRAMDITWTEKSCWVLEQLTTDSMFSTGLKCLVDKLIHRIHDRRERCGLAERHSLHFAAQLAEQTRQKLPDPHNIAHEGYRIVAQALLCRLRAAAANTKPFRAQKWQHLCPSYDVLRGEAHKIPNLADRILVLTEIGESMYHNEQAKGKRILDEAAELIEKIATQTDRVDRYISLANSFEKLGIARSAEFCITGAFDTICKMNKNSSVDAKLQNVMELAHTISPEFASNLASKTDDARIRYRAERRTSVLDLKCDPRRVNSNPRYLRPRVMKSAAVTVLRDLCSQRAAIADNRVMKEWLKNAPRHDFETVDAILAWFIENITARFEQSSISNLDPLFNRLLATVKIITPLCDLASGSTDTSVPDSDISSSLNIMTFPAGEQYKVTKTLEDFVTKYGYPYVKVHDPYFGPADINLLKTVPMDARVTIVTSTKDVLEGSERECFRREWRAASSQDPPQTGIFIYRTERKGTPIHDRFILCENAGLWIGTSVNSLGRKDTHIKFLSKEEKHKVETETVDRLVSSPPLYHEGERLRRTIFTL